MFKGALGNQAIQCGAHRNALAAAIEINLRGCRMAGFEIFEAVETLPAEVTSQPVKGVLIAGALQDFHVNDIGNAHRQRIVQQLVQKQHLRRVASLQVIDPDRGIGQGGRARS